MLKHGNLFLLSRTEVSAAALMLWLNAHTDILKGLQIYSRLHIGRFFLKKKAKVWKRWVYRVHHMKEGILLMLQKLCVGFLSNALDGKALSHHRSVSSPVK